MKTENNLEKYFSQMPRNNHWSTDYKTQTSSSLTRHLFIIIKILFKDLQELGKKTHNVEYADTFLAHVDWITQFLE